MRIPADIAAHIFAKPSRTAILIAALVIFTRCGTSRQLAYVVDVDPGTWQNPAVIVVPNDDTTTRYDLYIFLRANQRFTADTLPLRISVSTPDSVFFEERFLFTAPQTRFSSASNRESDALYRRRIQFAHTGDYRVTISPDMAIEGVEAVGIHLAKSK